MAEDLPTGAQDLAAGDFSSWLRDVQGAIRGERGADVPCGGCTACCTSSQFVHIGPDEVETLARVPAELLFPAPGRPRGHVVLGYDEQGHCPLLVDDRCSIYQHRPMTCRAYDCRVFPATGLDLDDDAQALISHRAQRWRFAFSSQADETEHEAVRTAAAFLDRHRDAWPEAGIPRNETQLAVLAIELHDAFLGRDEEGGQMAVVEPDPGVVREAVLRRRDDPGARRFRG